MNALQRAVELLTPFFATERDRQHWLLRAFYPEHKHIQNAIDTQGTADDFAWRCAFYLTEQHGPIDGKPALYLLLKAVQASVGHDRQLEITQVIEDLEHAFTIKDNQEIDMGQADRLRNNIERKERTRTLIAEKLELLERQASLETRVEEQIRLKHLIDENKTELAKIDQELQQWEAQLGSSPTSTPRNVESATGVSAFVNKRALRTAIDNAFSLADLKLLCSDLQEDLKINGQNIPVSLDHVGGDGKLNQIQNLIDYLERRGCLDALINVVRQTRPGIIVENSS